jgi:hypothetical protein
MSTSSQRQQCSKPVKFGHDLIAGDLVNWSSGCLNLGVIHKFDSGKLAYVIFFFVKFWSPYSYDDSNLCYNMILVRTNATVIFYLYYMIYVSKHLLLLHFVPCLVWPNFLSPPLLVSRDTSGLRSNNENIIGTTIASYGSLNARNCI